MTNDSSPEVPQDKAQPNNRKETFGETMERLRKKHRKVPPRHFFEDEGEASSNQPQQTEQELLFKVAAIKLANLEEEISKLIKDLPDDSFYEVEDVYFERFQPSNARSVTSYVENILGVGDEPAVVEFLDGIAEDKEQLGITTDRSLEIGIHTDEPTQKSFDEYAIKEPGLAGNANTVYYFTKDGICKKVSCIPSPVSVEPYRKPLRRGVNVNYYESEMTPSDFEIAGQALIMLKKRISPSISQDPNPSS